MNNLEDIAVYYFLSNRRRVKLPGLLKKISGKSEDLNLENIQMLAELNNDSFMEKRLSCGYLMSDDLYALGEEIWNKVSQK